MKDIFFPTHLILAGLLLLLPFIPVQAVGTEIAGNIPGYQHQAVFLLRPADYVSWYRTPVAVTLTDDKGGFSFTYRHADTTEVMVYTPRRQWPLTIVPGGAYNCVFQMGLPEPILRGKVPPFNRDLEELQTILRTLDANLQGPEPGKDQYATQYASLLKVRQRYLKHDNAWIRSHARYAIGYNLIEAASRLEEFDRTDSLEMALLFGAPIELQHPEYIRFIYYTVLNRLSVNTFRHYLRDPLADYGLPMDIMKREILWYPMELRPLVLLMAFKICYMNNWYQDRATHTRDLIALTAAFSESQDTWKKISQGLLSRFDRETEFPFDLPFCDASHRHFDLAEYRGKWVVLQLRLGTCEPLPGTTMDALPSTDRVAYLHLNANPSAHAFAPCDEPTFYTLQEWLGNRCGADIVFDPTGRIVNW